MTLDHSTPDGLASHISLSAPSTRLATICHRQTPTVRVSTVWHVPAITAARPAHEGPSHCLHERVVKRSYFAQLRGSAYD
jgi:hypothetical protein